MRTTFRAGLALSMTFLFTTALDLPGAPRLVRVVFDPLVRPPSSSIRLDAHDRADACDGGEPPSASRQRVSARVSSCAPSSRQPPSADGRDHQDATSH